ncbi:MAG: molybdopterin-dependent oxidoreductase, partial [Nitrospira sp.]|nr:molybdopterin-dependent oxidoreductase [Nitrospira sp.]
RPCQRPARHATGPGTHRWTVTFDDILDADVLLLVGTNITQTNPITGLKVKEAVKKRRATLITIESLEPVMDTMSNIANLAHHHFRIPPSEMQNGILGLMKAVIEEHLIPEDITQRYPTYVTAVTTALQQFSWHDLSRATGIESDAFIQAAKVLAAGRRVIVLTGQVLLRSERGYAGSLTLLDLLILTGKLDQPGCGFAPLAEENNDQGAVEMGAVTEFLPGVFPADDAAARERFMKQWNGSSVYRRSFSH